MTIYTKNGDKGETSLFGGRRISKDHIQVETYGSIDELSSSLGLLISKVSTHAEQQPLIEIQEDLYKIMAYLADANSPIDYLLERVSLFEQKIDLMQSKLPELHSFILPSGTEISAIAHIVRTICRRSERNVISFSKTTKKDSKDILIIIKYLNRLSDLFFVLARWYNKNRELKISLLRK